MKRLNKLPAFNGMSRINSNAIAVLWFILVPFLFLTDSCKILCLLQSEGTPFIETKKESESTEDYAKDSEVVESDKKNNQKNPPILGSGDDNLTDSGYLSHPLFSYASGFYGNQISGIVLRAFDSVNNLASNLNVGFVNYILTTHTLIKLHFPPLFIKNHNFRI